MFIFLKMHFNLYNLKHINLLNYQMYFYQNHNHNFDLNQLQYLKIVISNFLDFCFFLS